MRLQSVKTALLAGTFRGFSDTKGFTNYRETQQYTTCELSSPY